MTTELPHEKKESKLKVKKRDRHPVSLSDKQIVLKKLDELEEEIQLIRASLNVGTEMAAAAELAEKLSEAAPMCQVHKNENIVEQEATELTQKPDMQHIFSKIEDFLMQ